MRWSIEVDLVYQNGLASSLHAVQAQEERRHIVTALKSSVMEFQTLKNEGNAVLGLIVLNFGHDSTGSPSARSLWAVSTCADDVT